MIKLSKNRRKLTYDTYVKRGKISLLREGLSIDDPDHLYNYLANSEILKTHGFQPDDFGIEYPFAQKYKKLTEQQLILKIGMLQKHLNSIQKVI